MNYAIIGQESSPETSSNAPAAAATKKPCQCANEAQLHTVIVFDVFRLFLLLVIFRLSMELIKKYA